MNEKVKVSREVADFIESCKNSGLVYWEDQLLNEHVLSIANDFENVKEESKCLDKYSPIELAKILINGYEIQETPEEKILATYERQRAWQETNDPFDRRAHTAYGNAIVYTLDTLGIKIKGIND